MKLRPAPAILLVSAVAFVLAAVLLQPLLAPLEAGTLDRRLAWTLHLRGNAAAPAERSLPLCLVGIDDPTTRQLGKFGSGDWAVRAPFRQLLPVLQDFHPGPVCFDILFRPAGGSSGAAAAPAEIADAAARDAMRRLAATGPRTPATGTDLLLASRFTAEQAETGLAAAFLHVSRPPDAETPAIPIISAFDFQGMGGNTATVRPWSRADILGPDPASRDEEAGETIPYLLDLAIPAGQIRGIPADYPFAVNATLPSPAIRDAVLHGFINVPRDEDGIIRRIPLVLGFRYTNPATGVTREVFVPSFALLAVLKHWGLGPDAVSLEFGRALTIRRPGQPDLRVPVDGRGNLYLNFTGRVTDFTTLSFGRLLAAGGELRRARGAGTPLTPAQEEEAERLRQSLKGRIVLVGLTATGSTDIGPCPVDPNTPYAFIHMTAIANLLEGRFLRPASPGTAMLLLAALALLYTGLCLACGVRTLAPLTAAVAALWFIAAWLLMRPLQVALPLLGPLAYLALAFAGVLIYRHLSGERARRRIRRLFANMVSPGVLRLIEEDPGQAPLSAHRTEASVFFSDLAGSTTMAERLSPEDFTLLLNHYFEAMAEIILAAGGTLDKFEGDGIMAVWGVPYPVDAAAGGHAAAACAAALDQKAALDRLRPELLARFGVELHARFSICSGPVVAGAMGSQRRFQYTVIGDTVNQAARLEAVNRDYGTAILITESTQEQVRDRFHTRLLDRVVFAGKTRPVAIYELLGRSDAPLPPATAALVRAYEAALRLHWERRWDEAEAEIAKAFAAAPADLAAQRLRDRIREFRAAPPPPAWQGEIQRQFKC